MKQRKPPDAELAKLREAMRQEVARELGFDEFQEGYLGNATSAQCGRFGHILQMRARQLVDAGLKRQPEEDSEHHSRRNSKGPKTEGRKTEDS